MVDRQDIDALLVSALYGELTPAEEARLQSHLESHPGDRAALDDLKSAREAVKESRIFDLQAEPPQAISAMLLQEAHRRAPKRRDAEEKEGWFARFVRTFAMHPAMAAAATLVLVIGVAGVLYTRGGGEAAEKTASAPATETARADTEKPELPSPPAGGAAAGSGFEADVVAQKEASRQDQGQAATKGEMHVVGNAAPAASPEYKQQAPAHHSYGGIAVNRPEPQPKELEKNKPSDDQAAEGSIATDTTVSSRDRGLVGAGVTTGARAPSGAASNGAGPGNYAKPQAQPGPQMAQAAPPPPPATTSPQQAPAKPSAPAVKSISSPKSSADGDYAAQDKAKDSKPAIDVAWAKSQFARAIAYVNAQDCNSATTVLLGIQKQAPEYYNANVATDKRVRACMQYVQNAQERDAEKTGKARAQKRSEPSATQAK